ncbi:hypothetical protein UFOVP308_41 [uncultured Caudovirales phage]|jgi:hypothetical protein|uniref:Uncharacterized protein n=1 Tax=uncultured Caudovirales phage TaxID=2100421 RepID=A0A6J5LUF1_9CAUD|nr:hypothetical protein UFOVP308_41 [uncultured Caudovirales phage]
MLIDNEKEEFGELEIEEQKISQKAELPEKYRDKSLDDIVRMHQEAEKLIGKQAQEVGEVRKLADELIKQNLGSRQQQTRQEEPEVDFFENPQKAVQRTVDSHPDIIAARQATLEMKRAQIQQKLASEHPDFGDIAKNEDFTNWVKSSPVRIDLFKKADAEFDYDSANELLSTYKELRSVKQKQSSDAGEATRKQNLKAAGVDVGGSGESSKRVYRRADLIRLKMQDPNRYEALSDEIMTAYQEGRVR